MAIGIKEQLRLAALHSYHVLDTRPEPFFDDMVRDLARVARVPISLISLVDADRQWFKARTGLSATETERRISFCTFAVERDEDFLIVPDAARDPRFADSPLVTGAPHIRFYAGRVLKTPLGQNIGTINIIDTRPRQELSESIKDRMTAYSQQIIATFDRHRADRIFTEARRTSQGNDPAGGARQYIGGARSLR
ncbi:GAF domain-containing protein [Sphingobium sufflavum]|uniref:GAF domain-containing protein n=1 Tax=Sphingobium sufflavum TaxID=1129547 RepID=UPI001F4571A2|nr:GAF domain-containing protein [Sphingobium sufflavum]MCE7797377.1 GAF domain-containing protein [Sphingobium sufflavum]